MIYKWWDVKEVKFIIEREGFLDKVGDYYS